MTQVSVAPVQTFLCLFVFSLSGTSALWGPVWSATTSQAWWTSSGNSASATQTSCRPSARAPRSGLGSASTSSDTIAGTAAHWTATTPCLDVSCFGVSPCVCLHTDCVAKEFRYWAWTWAPSATNLPSHSHPSSLLLPYLSLLFSVLLPSLCSFSDLSFSYSRMLVLRVYSP